MIINDHINREYADLSCVGTLDTEIVATAKKNKYVVRVWLSINDGVIQQAKFKAAACNIVVATMNHWCRELVGKKVQELRFATNDDYVDWFELHNYQEKGSVMVEECALALIMKIMQVGEGK